jgi:hypothetical protein
MAMPTLDGLKEWFFLQTKDGQPCGWRLFRGSNTNKNYDGGSAESENPEIGWEKLRAHLEAEEWEPGEQVTIRVYGNGKLNGGGSDIIYRPISRHQARVGIAGIGGGMIGGDPQVYIAQQVSKEIELYDLRRQVQDLEQALNEKSSVVDRVINTVVEHPNFDPNALVNGIGSLLMNLIPQRANVGVQGFGQPTAPHTGEHSAQADRIAGALNRLQAHFPELPIETLLEKLADFVDSNPTVAKNVLTNLFK